MPARSEKQRKAACADLGRRRRGIEPRTFRDMSLSDLSDFCSSSVARHGGKITPEYTYRKPGMKRKRKK